MFSILIISGSKQDMSPLCRGLIRQRFSCAVVPDGEKVTEQVLDQSPDLILMDIDNALRIKELTEKLKQEKERPVLALVSKEMLGSIGEQLKKVDDFVIGPFNLQEIVLRSARLLHRANAAEGEVITCGDLQINLARYEVSLSGRVIILTFMEYELLKFLVNHQGRVFTRDVLLNKVWGYDYYGGDRTVDVHIRRLRSKIEDSTHTFIETVRSIGYKFVC
jgi:DNA-binding response OmpR family regulator